MAIPDDAEELVTVPMDWAQEGPEWRVRLPQAFDNEAFSSPSMGWNYEDGFFRQPLLEDETDTGVELCWLPDHQGVRMFLLPGAGVRVSSDLRDQVRRIVEKAAQSMGQEPLDMHWWAIIGTRDFPWFDQPFTVGDLAVTPAKLVHVNWVAPRAHPSVTSRHTERWCLLKVEGSDRGHDADTACGTAARRVNALAALLGVATGEPFEIRSAPWLANWSTPDIAAPTPVLDMLVESANQSHELAPFNAEFQGAPAHLPNWFEAGWHMMGHRAWLARTVLTFSEGMTLAEDHPSLAGVAFIAAIEGIANRVIEVDMCSCGQHRDVTAKFKATVELVCNAPELDLLNDAYKVRSKLVHQGVLPGMEPARGGHERFDPYTVGEFDVFLGRLLPTMREAARALLQMALTDTLPPKRRITTDD